MEYPADLVPWWNRVPHGLIVHRKLTRPGHSKVIGAVVDLDHRSAVQDDTATLSFAVPESQEAIAHWLSFSAAESS